LNGESVNLLNLTFIKTNICYTLFLNIAVYAHVDGVWLPHI